MRLAPLASLVLPTFFAAAAPQAIAFNATVSTPQFQRHSFNTTVGPNPAPPGCDVAITSSNDRPGSGGVTGCPWEVFDASLQSVDAPSCVDNPVLLPLRVGGVELGHVLPGTTTLPRLDLPPLPELVGLTVHTAYATLDLGAACPVARTSSAVAHLVLP